MEKIKPIILSGGTGEGITPLAAFHEALRRSGIENCNLLTLSSVIPPGAVLTPVGRNYRIPDSEFGNRLYVVASEQRSDIPGAGIAAGIGWTQYADGRGYFVEHHQEVLPDPDETDGDKLNFGSRGTQSLAVEGVVRDIQRSLRSLEQSALEDITAGRSGLTSRIVKGGMTISATTVKNRPACSLAVAVYEFQDWKY